jgi:pimeloyl-ACP methyl ester carboxylesterase
MSAPEVRGRAGKLAVDDGGEGGLPVVFVHSLAGNIGQWKPQLEHVRRDRRAVAFDLRGHGRSDPAVKGSYSIADMASDVAAVVDALRLERFVLVGHSMGGGAALVYAGDHPNRVAALLLVDPIGDGKQIPAEAKTGFLAGFESNYDTASQEYWKQIAGKNPAISQSLLADLRSTSGETVVAVLRSVMEFDPEPALARYRGLKLAVVTPHNDEAFSLHRVGDGFPHRAVTGTGHWIQLDKPEEFNSILDEFLHQVPGS